jgi:hypothetical protein
VDYGQKIVELAQSLKPGSTPEENAAPLILKAIELRDKARAATVSHADPNLSPTTAVDFSLLYTKFNPANPGATGNTYGDEAEFNMRRDFTKQALDKYREMGVFDTLSKIAARPVMVRAKHEGRLLEIMLPDLGAIRDLARANAARMRMAREAKDAKEFTQAFEQSMGLARVCTAEPILISNLVGVAVAALAMSETRDAITAGDMTPEMLRAVSAALDRQNLHGITHALGGERIFTLDMIQWTHTDDGHGDGLRIVSEANRLQEWGTGTPSRSYTRLANLAAAFYPTKKQLTTVVDDYYSKLNDYAKTPAFQRRSATWTPTGASVALPWN